VCGFVFAAGAGAGPVYLRYGKRARRVMGPRIKTYGTTAQTTATISTWPGFHDRHVGPEPAGSLEQRRFVGDHNHRSERSLEQPAHALRETVVAICQQNATRRLLGH
jgi:hypothetical protein